MIQRLILSKGWIFFYLFLAACSSYRQVPDQELVEGFIQRFFFEEGAVYTLFGEKPMTDLLIFCGDEQDISLEGLAPDSLARIVYQDDITLTQWKAWCKHIQTSQFNNYLFITRQSRIDPSCLIYGIVNISLLEQLFLQYEKEFKKIDPQITFPQAVHELQQEDSLFWQAVFANHYLNGLLYGYGEENSRYFFDCMQQHTTPLQFSKSITTGLIHSPIYAITHTDSQEKMYLSQQHQIEMLYQGKDWVHVTLEQLRKHRGPSSSKDVNRSLYRK